MSAEVSVRNKLTGDEKFYSTFKEAIANAQTGDTITIHKDTGEELHINKTVNVTFVPGLIIKRKKEQMFIIVTADECSISSFTLVNED